MKKLLRLYLSLICAASLHIYTQDTIEIRHLQPPNLEMSHFGKQILCHRPMRYGTPKLAVETIGNKIVADNYGHGGSGWTLAPGCARYIVDQCKKAATTSTLDTPITVIGAGALGLFVAYELVTQGYTHITIIAERYDNLVSHNAGGFLAPSTMEVTPETQHLVDSICFDAYRFYADIAHGNNNDFPAQAALIMPIYLKRPDDRLQAYENIVMQKPHDVIIDFDNGKQYEMKVYDDGIFMDTGILMESLTSFLQNKVTWVQQRVTSFDEINTPIIFNCSGLGARHLNDDKDVVSVQGHLILLEDQNPEDMNYMISFYVEPGKTESGQYAKRSIYMFPKHMPDSDARDIGVMGGTFIEGADNQTPNQEEFDLIIKRSKEFFGT
ncbi:MAG: FAD-dependent oxidoreductase [Candidatus Babeliales bacterium]